MSRPAPASIARGARLRVCALAAASSELNPRLATPAKDRQVMIDFHVGLFGNARHLFGIEGAGRA